jgi:PKD repeat protein
MPPLPGSPAIGAGSVSANIFSTDQSGYPRTEDGLIDLGAMELPIMPPFTASPTMGTPPFSVQFNSTNFDINGGAIIGWNWDFGDGTTGTGQNPSHVYSAAGIFSPILIVTNSLGWPQAVSGPAITGSSTLLVTNNADSGPGTLRSAITNAANGAVITFDPSLSGATITLSNTLTINKSFTIDASALSGGLQINEDDSVFVQIFNVASNTTVFLNSLTITNGYSAIDSVYNNGGGIENAGTLTLANCTLSGNGADLRGGGIYNSGTLTMNQCTVSGSYAVDGGGIYNLGTATLNQCTLSGNCAGWVDEAGGGGINNRGLLSLNQCTLSGNSATGIFSHNGGGGGIQNIEGRLAMTNTIVAGNGGTGYSGHYGEDDIANLGSAFIVGGSNLVQSVYNYTIFGGPFNDPPPLTDAADLAPLGNYGGPTQTMPPLLGSPAIDAGSDSVTNFLATDQRGYPRTQNGLIDLGAVELQSPAANPSVLTNPSLAANGTVVFGFTNVSNADFTVLATTNLALPLGQWSILGQAVQNVPGQYQFTAAAAAKYPRQFYRVVSP